MDQFTDAIAMPRNQDHDVLPETTPTVAPFSQMPGPKGLPIVGTLFQYLKKDGPKFSKMFEVWIGWFFGWWY